ncbi:MAG: hypothetical protein FK730_15500 [Asgard group archaeon]|nr:hypothetical protein [Asgard group archaeon]
MKWSEFRKKYPEEIFTKVRKICEEQHIYKSCQVTQAGKLCRSCYAKEGKYCFPCEEVINEYVKRHGKKLEILSV